MAEPDWEYKVGQLPAEMVEYELVVRGLTPATTVGKRKDQLVRHLNTMGNATYIRQVDPRLDIESCEIHLARWTREMNEYHFTHAMADGYMACLEFLKTRINSMSATIATTAPDLTERHKILVEKCSKFEDEVRNTTFVDRPTQRRNTGAVSKHGSTPHPGRRSRFEDWSFSLNERDANSSSPVRPAPPEDTPITLANLQEALRSIGQRNTVLPPEITTQVGRPSIKEKIWKWGLQFSGEPGEMYVSDFILRVKELARSRDVSLEEVFESACELFTGNALLWFRAGIESREFTNWRELEFQLRENFEKFDFGEDLMDYVKHRKQKTSERVVLYFAIMQNLFRRVDPPITEAMKIKIIKRNLLPEYIPALSLRSFSSLPLLKDCCKTLEADYDYVNRNNMRHYREPHQLPRQVRFGKNLNEVDERRSRDRNRSSLENDYFASPDHVRNSSYFHRQSVRSPLPVQDTSARTYSPNANRFRQFDNSPVSNGPNFIRNPRFDYGARHEENRTASPHRNQGYRDRPRYDRSPSPYPYRDRTNSFSSDKSEKGRSSPHRNSEGNRSRVSGNANGAPRLDSPGAPRPPRSPHRQ